MMRALRWFSLAVVFTAAGLGYLLFATAANWAAVRLIGHELRWLDAHFLWNVLVFGGFVFCGGTAAACVAAITARRALDVPRYLRASGVVAIWVVALVTTFQDIGRLTGGG